MRAYLELCRASNLPTVWTNVLAAVVLSGVFAPARALAAGVACTLAYLGGMALNDLLDIEEDRVRKPERPLPSGRVSVRGAWIFTLALFAAGLAALASTRLPAIAAYAGLILTIWLYDSLHGRNWLTVFLMAACRAWVFVLTGLAVAGTVNRGVALGAAVQFAYIFALTAIARLEKRGVKVPPIPWLLAGISLVDGALLAAFAAPVWALAGVAGCVSTRLAQTQVRGD